MKSSIIKNILSLFCIQGAGYLIPLITLPYLVRVLGPTQYGILGFSLSFVQYFSLLVQYGFDLSATNKIAANKDNKVLVSEVFWAVILCKLFLLLACAVIMVAMVNFIPKLQEYSSTILIAYTIVIGSSLVPSWLFQGKEKMVCMAISNIATKLLTLPFIFIFVHSPYDIWIVVMLTGIGSLLGALSSIYFVYKEGWVSFIFPKVSLIKEVILDGRYIFYSNIAGSLYINSIPIFIGFLCGPSIVGVYVAADKIRMAFQGLMGPFTQVFYPRISNLISNKKSEGLKLIRKIFIWQNGIVFTLCLILVALSKYIIIFLYGDNYLSSVSVLSTLAIVVFFVSISTVLGVQGMLIIGKRKQFSQILCMGAVVNTIILYPLIKFYGADGAAISVLLTEVIVTFGIVSQTKSIWAGRNHVK